MGWNKHLHLAYNAVSRIDRYKIVMFIFMFMWVRNPMITLKSSYDSWLAQHSKWLPSKPAEITLISQWAQYWQYTPHVPARNVRKLCYVIIVFAYYSASRIDRDKISASKPMFFSDENPMMTLQNPYDYWLTLG